MEWEMPKEVLWPCDLLEIASYSTLKTAQDKWELGTDCLTLVKYKPVRDKYNSSMHFIWFVNWVAV